MLPDLTGILWAENDLQEILFLSAGSLRATESDLMAFTSSCMLMDDLAAWPLLSLTVPRRP